MITVRKNSLARFASIAVALFVLATFAAAQSSSGAGGAVSPASKPSSRPTAAADKLDINTATIDQLKEIPGIEAYAQKIIDGRPYQIRDELVRKKILSAEAYARIKGRVIAAEK